MNESRDVIEDAWESAIFLQWTLVLWHRVKLKLTEFFELGLIARVDSACFHLTHGAFHHHGEIPDLEFLLKCFFVCLKLVWLFFRWLHSHRRFNIHFGYATMLFWICNLTCWWVCLKFEYLRYWQLICQKGQTILHLSRNRQIDSYKLACSFLHETVCLMTYSCCLRVAVDLSTCKNVV